MATILRGGHIVTMNPAHEDFVGDVRFEGARITAVQKKVLARQNDKVIDVTGHFVIPGLIQAHTHLCQALFRGFADDLKLMDWLKKRIWPMERAHNAESIQASARIALLEMQLLGTTTILDMGTVRHTEETLQVVRESGMRYVGGKCLMDLRSASGPLYEATDKSLQESEWLIQRWHKKNELIDYALCPRFVVSCTERLLKDCVDLQQRHGLFIHTHASESREEIALVKKRTGKNNVDYLDHIGMLGPRTAVVHGVHLTRIEINRLVRTRAGLVHCPSSNLKLASGIAPIEAYVKSGVRLGIGSDGAPCNNTMDPFLEMRLAALLQKPHFGPEALPAKVALELATLGGARVLGRESDLGSIEPGKLADIVVVERRHPSVATVENPYSALVYSSSGRDVRQVWINGQWVVRDQRHFVFDHQQVVAHARDQRRRLFVRAGLA